MDEVLRYQPSGSFTAANQTVGPFSLGNFTNVTFAVKGTFAAGLNFLWEVSMDGNDWYPVQAVRIDAGTAELASGSLTTNQKRAWDAFVGSFNYIQFRSTAWASPSGSAEIWALFDNSGVDPAIIATVAGHSAVVGTAAHSGNINTYPVCVGGQAKSTIDTALVDGDASYLTLTTARQVVTKDFAGAELDWTNSQTVSTSGTDTAIAPARAASVRNYVTAVQLQNSGAAATTVTIKDGASTVLWTCDLPANMATPVPVVFPTPLRGTAATAMNINSSAATTLRVNAQGFQNF